MAVTLGAVKGGAAPLRHHEGLAGLAGREEELHALLLHDRCRGQLQAHSQAQRLDAPSGNFFAPQTRLRPSLSHAHHHLGTGSLQGTYALLSRLLHLNKESHALDVIMEGIGPTDDVLKGLSTLSQFLLYRHQLLNNPGPGPWIVADWKALRTNAGRATLISKYQRPFTSLRDDERNRCARFLLSLLAEAVPPNSIGEAEFYGFVDCLLQSRIKYDKHLRDGAQLLSDVEENVFSGVSPASQNWHLWAHANTRVGATGILAASPARTLSSLILLLSNRRRLSLAGPVQLEPLPARAENSSFEVFQGLPANSCRKHP